MNKKISVGAAISISAIIAAITFAITWMVSTNTFAGLISGSSNRSDIQKKINEIDSLISKNYIGEYDVDNLLDSIANGYVSGIDDQYAVYYSEEEMKERTQEQNGYMTGVGIAASQNDDGYIEIVTIYENSPASEAGLEVGDSIVKVDSTEVQELSFTEAIEMIKGEEGTTVNITVRRDGKDTEYELTRAEIELETVSYRMIDNYGYIQITSFKKITISQFEKALKDLVDNGAKGLIFDLRNDGGGTVESVVGVMNQILPEGTLGHYEYKDGSTTELGTSDANFVDLPMVVLTNSNTASAAELFAANIRDYEMGSLVGETTYGKGVSQSMYTFSDGSGISFTTAYFNSAKSDNFNGVGIEPDYEVKLSEANSILYSSGTLNDADDNQLQKAIDVLTTTE